MDEEELQDTENKLIHIGKPIEMNDEWFKTRGIFLTPKLLGYDKDEDGNLVINESEADTVRLCYYLFLSGFPTSEIAEILMDLGCKTKLGKSGQEP